jgi:uncharacterized repeat protein (TIGR03803 family)
MISRTRFWLVLFLAPLSAIPGKAADYQVLYSFAGRPNSGYNPKGNLTIDGSTLYGMTDGGGTNGLGTIFKIGMDGGGFTVLRSFAGGANDGMQPNGSLTMVGSQLYGLAAGGSYAGPGYSDGVAFGIRNDGNGFSLLHTFTGGSDGKYPGGNLTFDGSSTLYGMNRAGGTNSMGVIFKMGMDGSNFTSLHSLQLSDGANPFGSLVLSGSNLYGMACFGGSADDGTVFQVNTTSGKFTVLHSFADGEGNTPYGSLTLVGSALYGMTTSIGTNNSSGTIFKVNTDGSAFSVLHSFVGGSSDGFVPHGDLTLVGSDLYGMTYSGGSNNLGTIFKTGLDGSGFSVLHSFLGGDDGRNPEGDLVISGSTLYGMTGGGGGTNNSGTVFSLTVPEPSTLALSFAGSASLLLYLLVRAWRWRKTIG